MLRSPRGLFLGENHAKICAVGFGGKNFYVHHIYVMCKGNFRSRK